MYIKKLTSNIIFNGERLKTFHIRSGIRQRYYLSTCLFNIILEVLANSVGQGKENKDTQNLKEEIKLSLFKDNMIVSADSPKNSQ